VQAKGALFNAHFSKKVARGHQPALPRPSDMRDLGAVHCSHLEIDFSRPMRKSI
jgi:hypothetical protein